MAVQYISDSSGHTTAVIIPISEWNTIRSRHPDIDALESEIPQWQKEIVDQRLQFMNNFPGNATSLEDFTSELNAGLKDEY